jgi:GAF domain-containing protein
VTAIPSVDSVLMIADIARTLNDFRPLEETLDHICLRVGGLSGHDFTAMFTPDEKGESLVVRGSWGMSQEYVSYVNEQHRVRLEPTTEHGLSPTAEAFRGGRPVMITDVEAEPSFEPWKTGARLQRYRSLGCIPVIVRSQVIGVLNCYGREPHHHSPEEVELLQLVARLAGVAIETARVAEGQREAVAKLRELSEQLREQNRELSRLSSIQSRLTKHLTQPDATAVERTAGTLADLTGRAVLVADISGNVITYAGPPTSREAAALVAARREVAELLRRDQLVSVDGCTCIRLGLPEMPLGLIVLHPALGDERSTTTLAAIHAAAVVTAELQGERADRALETYARPAVVLATAHGLYGRAQLREVAGVIGIPVDSTVRVALFRCPTPESAHRLSRRPENLRGAGWPVIAATPAGRDAMALLSDSATPEQLRRAAMRLRERRPEVERIGVSSALTGLAALAQAREQAQTAAAVDGDESATLFEDLGPFGAVASDLPPARVAEVVDRSLGVLIEHDAARATRLVETLNAYVVHSGRIQEASAALGIHPNTFHQRLRRAAQLAGFDLHDYRSLAALVLALEWDRMLRARGRLQEEAK